MGKSRVGLMGAMIALLLGLGPQAWAGGGMEGGGGDTFTVETDSAWFLGDRPIRYCLVGGQDEIGISQTQVRSMIEEAFSKWKSYIDYKGVMKGSEAAPEEALVLNRQAMDSCDGTEDLKFYLGVGESEVLQAKQAYNRPVAFAHRNRYDRAAGWGQGFIWISGPSTSFDGLFPDWSRKPDTLFAFIMHELGHVLGNTHVQDTIMDEDIAEVLLVGLTDSKNVRRIDWGAELAENRYDRPRRGRMSADAENSEAASNFRRIFGRDPSGEVKVELRGDPTGGVGLEIIFEDAKGLLSVVLTFTAGTSNDYSFIRIPNPIFKRACRGVHCTGAIYQRLHAGYRVGTLRVADGTSLPAFVEMNLGKWSSQVDAPVSVKYWEDGRKHDLFAETELR